jgi:mRNA interferase MazF
VSQIYTVDKKDLVEKIGTLSPKRINKILDGVHILLDRRDIEE